MSFDRPTPRTGPKEREKREEERVKSEDSALPRPYTPLFGMTDHDGMTDKTPIFIKLSIRER